MDRLVMIADIVGSRKLNNREEVQAQLETQLDALNASREQMLSPYTITLGDEFQADFEGADRVFPDLLALMRALYPVRVRFVFGLGSISTEINTSQAIGMDGPAFYKARDLLNHQIPKWRPNRQDVLWGLLCGLTIPGIAQRLDITQQSVYKNIRDGGLESVIELIHVLTGRMNSALSNAN